MPKEPQPDWKPIEVDLPRKVRRMVIKAADLAGFTEEEMVRAIVALSLVSK